MNTFGYMAIVKLCRVYLAQVSKRPVHFKLLKITFCYFPTCLLSSKASGSMKTGGLVFEARELGARELFGPVCTLARFEEVRECSADDFHELGVRVCPAKLAKWCQREQLYR